MQFRKFVVQEMSDGAPEVTFPAPEIGLVRAKRLLGRDPAYAELKDFERGTLDGIAWVIVCAGAAKADVGAPSELTVDSVEGWAMTHAFDFEGGGEEGGAAQENPTGTAPAAS